MEIIKADKLDDVELDMIRAAKAEEIDSKNKKVKYDGKWYKVEDGVILGNENMEDFDELGKDDYFVMIDTGDDDSDVDYLFFVVSADDVEDMKYNMTNFLNQNN